MDEQKQKLIDRIQQAQNVLVAVSSNPSVDQLAAAIGFTLVLNHMDKHGTAVFSGQVPSTIEFLKPEETLEKNTDSLRDFIIALDKSKADKLRYKVEDDVVRIFITPYKTSLGEKDLQFSQGDFNVDVVVCLGVNEQQDLDAAITAHGRILHDATVVSVSTTGQGSLGSINWVDPQASSLSEMMVSLTDSLSKKALDNQVATALLTGIVANTERFRNDRTTPKTMSAAAELMAAGANQQLIATELEAPVAPPEPPAPEPAPEGEDGQPQPGQEPPAPEKKAEPGTLEIDHRDDEPRSEPIAPEPTPEAEPPQPQIHVDEDGRLMTAAEANGLPAISHVRGVGSNGQTTDSDTDVSKDEKDGKGAGKTEVRRELMTELPELKPADLTANVQPEGYDLPTEELTLPAVNAPLLSHNETVLPPAPPAMPGPLPGAATPVPPQPAVIAPQPAPPTVLPTSTASTPIPAPTPPPVATSAPRLQPQPTVAMPMPPTPAATPVSAADEDRETLTQIEQSVHSPHLQMDDGQADTPTPGGSGTNKLNDARSAVEAALSGAGAGNDPLQPIAALNAQPLGPDLHGASVPEPAQPAAPASSYIPPANLFSPAPAPAAPVVPNMGFSEPTPGNSPADETLDMPLPAGMPTQAAPSGMGTASAPPSAFPGIPGQGGMNMGGLGGQTPPPPVPPPMLPPLQ